MKSLRKVANDPRVAACMALERDIEAQEVLGVPRVHGIVYIHLRSLLCELMCF